MGEVNTRSETVLEASTLGRNSPECWDSNQGLRALAPVFFSFPTAEVLSVFLSLSHPSQPYPFLHVTSPCNPIGWLPKPFEPAPQNIT